VLPDIDPNTLATVAVEINGQPTLAFASPTKMTFWNGGDLHDINGNVLVRHGQAVSDDLLSELKKASSAGAIAEGVVQVDAGKVETHQLNIRGEDGSFSTWYGVTDPSGAVKGWSQGKPDPQNLKPMPIALANPVSQQVVANKLNVDPTGQTYISGRGDAARAGAAALMTQAGIHGSLAGGSGGPQAPGAPHGGFFEGNPFGATQPPAGQAAPRNPFNAGGSNFGAAPNFLSGHLQQTAQQLGIVTRQPSLPTINKATTAGRGGFFANEPFSGPSIQSFKLNLPKVNIPDINLTPFATSSRDEIRNATQHLAGPAGGGLIR
jgi:hypothetical protein